jgi:nucleotide-binding universal stress UspA family protein
VGVPPSFRGAHLRLEVHIMSKPIVVGYDGSAASVLALEWAVTAASQRKAPLKIVTTWSLPGLPFGMGMGTAPAPSLEDDAEREAIWILDQGVAKAKELDPSGGELSVAGAAIDEAPAKALKELSRDAKLLVLGTHGRHGISGALLGSVSGQVMTHAECPVVVIRERAHKAAKEVVVGIDGSPPSRKALEFAVEHASLSGLRLRVLHAWEMPAVLSPTTHETFSAGEILRDFKGAASRGTAEMVAGVAQEWPDVRVEQEVVQGMAAKRLIEVSENAALLVVGSRGHGGFVGLLLGSVSNYVGHHAKCPVVIVH